MRPTVALASAQAVGAGMAVGLMLRAERYVAGGTGALASQGARPACVASPLAVKGSGGAGGEATGAGVAMAGAAAGGGLWLQASVGQPAAQAASSPQ